MRDLPTLPNRDVFYRSFPHYFTDRNVSVIAGLLRESAKFAGYDDLKLVRLMPKPCGCREATFRLIKAKRIACEVRSGRGH